MQWLISEVQEGMVVRDGAPVGLRPEARQRLAEKLSGLGPELREAAYTLVATAYHLKEDFQAEEASQDVLQLAHEVYPDLRANLEEVMRTASAEGIGDMGRGFERFGSAGGEPVKSDAPTVKAGTLKGDIPG